jgi:hypothetical protein
VTWQVILPVVLAGLIMAGMIILVSAATFRGNGDVGRWAAISTIWLVIPVMIGGLVLLVAVAAIAYLLGRLTGLIPPYTYQAQSFASRVEAGARRVEELAHQPLKIVPEIGWLIKKAFKKMRGG